MDPTLHAVTLPGAIGDLHFEIGSFTGLDRLLLLLPERLQLEHVARRIVRDLTARGAKFNRHITFRMPNGKGPWEVVLGPVIEVGKGSRQRSVTVRLWKT
jgi:hypothetical protein